MAVLRSLTHHHRPAGPGVAVSEITSGIRARSHSLTPWAEVTGLTITYPGATASQESPAGQRARRRRSKS